MGTFSDGNDAQRVASARKCAAITPHNTNELTTYARAIYVGGTGDVTLIAAGDSAEVTFKAVPAGTILPVLTKIVKATGTDATFLVALFG